MPADDPAERDAKREGSCASAPAPPSFLSSRTVRQSAGGAARAESFMAEVRGMNAAYSISQHTSAYVTYMYIYNIYREIRGRGERNECRLHAALHVSVLYFCTSKASKLSTSCLSPFALSQPVATSVRGLELLVYSALSY